MKRGCFLPPGELVDRASGFGVQPYEIIAHDVDAVLLHFIVGFEGSKVQYMDLEDPWM